MSPASRPTERGLTSARLVDFLGEPTTLLFVRQLRAVNAGMITYPMSYTEPERRFIARYLRTRPLDELPDVDQDAALHLLVVLLQRERPGAPIQELTADARSLLEVALRRRAGLDVDEPAQVER